MKNTIKYISYSTLLSLSLVSCSLDFDQPVEDTPDAVQSSGEADFSTFVALGDSLTAGFADNALYIDGQNDSFVNFMAMQMQAAGGGEFTTPLMADNIGGFPGVFEQTKEGVDSLDISGNTIRTFPARRVLDASISSPVIIDAESTTLITDVIPGPYNNTGIPGAKSFHLLSDTYGDLAGLSTGTANPYFTRMASSSTASPLADVMAQEPTFFSLWIGANDVLGFATDGGAPDGDTITDPSAFENFYSLLVSQLISGGAKGLLTNIPSVASLPFFNTIPNNALVLDAEQAANLTGFFQAYSAIFAGGATQNLLGLGLDLETASATANALAAQYAFTFNEGANRFLIASEITSTNPLGIRQMTSSELLLLTIDQGALSEQGYGSVAITDEVLAVLGKLQAGGTPTSEEGQLVLGAANPIIDKDVLDDTEQTEITTATDAYNETIEALAIANNLAFYDAASRVDQLADDGISVNGSLVTSAFVTGGFFSLDGIHLSPKGNGTTANEMIERINIQYGSTLDAVETRNLTTVHLK